MKKLPNLNLTNDEYINIINSRIAGGGEGIICPGLTNHSLIKLFIGLDNKRCPMSENKEKKLTKLYQSNFDGLVKPIRTISFNGIIIGYEMTYDQLDLSLKNSNLSRKELIRALKDSKDILIRLSNEDITYGDVTEDNILFNKRTGKAKFCDIDNIRIGTLPIDIKGFSLNKYYSETGFIDETSDAYMHNLLTIRSLAYSYDTYDTEVLLDLKRGIYPTKFKQSAQEIFSSMSETKTFNGKYVVQYIKR